VISEVWTIDLVLKVKVFGGAVVGVEIVIVGGLIGCLGVVDLK
jgi:hypothetical protein